jgi:hypothetical protein
VSVVFSRWVWENPGNEVGSWGASGGSLARQNVGHSGTFDMVWIS